MMFSDMLDNRKPKPCAALCTAAALVDAVKSLEYPGDTLLRDPRPRIGHSQLFVSEHYFDISVLTVILYGIVHKVVDQLTDLRPAAFDGRTFSADSYPDTTLFCLL